MGLKESGIVLESSNKIINYGIMQNTNSIDELEKQWDEFKAQTVLQKSYADIELLESSNITNAEYYCLNKLSVLSNDDEIMQTKQSIPWMLALIKELSSSTSMDYIQESAYMSIYNNRCSNYVSIDEIGFSYKFIPKCTPDELDEYYVELIQNNQQLSEDDIRYLYEYHASWMISGVDYPSMRDILVIKNNAEQGDKSSVQNLLKLGAKHIYITSENFLNRTNTIKKNTLQLVDLREMKSSIDIDDKLITYEKSKLYPIYIVLSYTNTLFGKIERSIIKNTYSHAAISLDPSLNKMYSFNNTKKYGKGLSFESINGWMEDSKDAIIDVLAIFVTPMQYNLIVEKLNWYISNIFNTKYSIENLINILLNKVKDTSNSLNLICSQFVDIILKTGDIDITGKSSNLVIPKDFELSTDARIFHLYEGKANAYDSIEIQKKIHALMVNNKNKKLSIESSRIHEINDIYILKQSNLISDNIVCQEIFNEVDNLLNISSVFVEMDFPINIDDDGSLLIAFPHNYYKEYEKCHLLLKTYKEYDNIDGIKYELAKMYFLLYKYELLKLDKMPDGPIRKKMIDNRARVINDYKTYLSYILEKDNTFNLSEYIQNTPYDPNRLRITKNTYRSIAKIIKSYLE